MKTWVIIVAFSVVVGVLAFFILTENTFLSPALRPDCESQDFSVDQSDREFYGWEGDGEPKVGDIIRGNACNTPDARCLAKHGISPNDNSIYSVRADGVTSGRNPRPVWAMSCSICKDIGWFCECK